MPQIGRAAGGSAAGPTRRRRTARRGLAQEAEAAAQAPLARTPALRAAAAYTKSVRALEPARRGKLRLIRQWYPQIAPRCNAAAKQRRSGTAKGDSLFSATTRPRRRARSNTGRTSVHGQSNCVGGPGRRANRWSSRAPQPLERILKIRELRRALFHRLRARRARPPLLRAIIESLCVMRCRVECSYCSGESEVQSEFDQAKARRSLNLLW